MQRILKFTSRVSVIIFLGMLLYVYAFLPEKVGLLFDESGLAVFSLGKEPLFYFSTVFILLINLITHLFDRSLSAIPVSSSGLINSDQKKLNLMVWSSGFSLILNIIMIFSITFIGLYYNSEHFNINYFSFLVYVGPILLIMWIFVLFYFLLSDNKKASVNE